MRPEITRKLLSVFIPAMLFFFPFSASATVFPERPPNEHFYVDQAGLITGATGDQIDEIAMALLDEEAVPLYVVTIESLASMDAGLLDIESYATMLFDHWGIGWEKHNYGMLLLISKGDRKARIELGGYWGHEHDGQAETVMNTLIVPAFKDGDFPTGIVDGTAGLDAMARGLDLPKPQVAWWILPLYIGIVLFLIGLIWNLFKTGRKGWAWVLIGVVGIILFYIMRAAATSNSGGGFGGSSGGFGGGSSGGGGATGSW